MEENKRALWTSLIADLEEDCKAPPPEEPFQSNNGNVLCAVVATPVPSSSTGTSQLCDVPPSSSNSNKSIVVERGFSLGKSNAPLFHQKQQTKHQLRHRRSSSPPGLKEPPPAPLPCTMSLYDWTMHHAKNRQACPNTATWRGSQRNKKGDKTYLETAVQIALSMATKLEQQSKPSIHVRDIVMKNVVVINTQDGETDFIQRSNYAGCSSRNQRLEIAALGRILYEMFTHGSSPPLRKAAPASNSSVFSRDDLRMSIAEDKKSEDEDGYEQARPQRRRREDQGEDQNVRALLVTKGMPSSVCRLVADMLENEVDPSGLLCNDQVISTLTDVVCDLQQMMDAPQSFLHDSLLMRWKPVLSNKLYCRDAELQQALAVAGSISQCGNEKKTLMDDLPISHGVLMVSGHSGSGKSHFVREISAILENKGWRYLYCKFDRVNPRPLSFITSAFDRYFGKLMNDSKHLNPDFNEHSELKHIRKRIVESFRNENMTTLCHLIPIVGQVVASEREFACEANLNGFNFDSVDTEASKCRLHHLFGLLVKAISQKPVMLFLDDLHWADQASLDLMTALVHGVEHSSEGSHVLFVGSYRSNEVADSDPLKVSLRQINSLSNVTLTEIPLNGLSSDNVNVMISDALRYPRRLTKTLADVIHEKSIGNPLFVKEILNELTVENMLNYSLSSRKWEWDEDLINARTVSDGVAEFLTRRILRYPDRVLKALQVISIFGSEVSMRVLIHVSDVCGIPDIFAELDRPSREGLINVTTETCSFVHDMVQHSVHMGIKPQESRSMLKEISETLLDRTSKDREEAILFILVDLINRLGSEGASTTDRMHYANLNLVAGEKAMQTPDFESACTYLESGISFLHGCYWEDSYNLSLHLFRDAAFVQYAQGRTDLMMKRINEVLDNARSFDDKLDTYNVLIQFLSLDAKGVSKAFEQSFLVLEQLGESFPTIPENEIIGRDLIEVKMLLEQHTPSSISNLRPLDHPQKVKAMKCLPMLACSCYQQKSRFFPLVACRMVKITLEYGIHEKSAFGLSTYALAYATVFKNMSEGYKLGKYALALTAKKNFISRNIPEVYSMVYGGVNIWKEPIQAVLPEIMNGYTIGMESGNVNFSLMNSMLYVYRAFLSGTKLATMSKDVSLFMRLYSLYKRHTFRIAAAPFHNAIVSLVGCTHPLIQKMGQINEDDDQILAKSLEVKELNVAETVVVCKMMRSFIFRDLDTAEEVASQYLGFFEQLGSGVVQFINIHRYFYGGLIAFHCFRKSGRQDWLNIGEVAISRFEAWTIECEWNFQNKLLLLQAEHQFATGLFSEAGSTYSLAITSAKAHRFVHEEAISCELAGIFYGITGENEKSSRRYRRAVECYTSWGAHKKATLLHLSLK